jgi:PAS domain S-box-containing protein
MDTVIQEESLSVTQECFYKLISIADDVVWIMSLDGNQLYYINPSFEHLYGKTVFDLKSNPNLWIDIVHPEDKQIAVDSLNELFISGYSQKEYRIIIPDGSTVWLHDKKHIIRDSQGKTIQIGCIARDITEHKKTLEKLHEYKNDLQALTQELSLTEEKERRRIAMELHDHAIQNLAYCKIKLDEFYKDTTAASSENIINELKDIISGTIQSIRTLTFELSPPVLYELGLEPAIVWLGENILLKRGILFRIESDNFEDNLNQKMRILLFQIIRELLNNSAKHSKARETIVTIKKKDDHIFIVIQDDGVGFDVDETIRKKSLNFGFFSIQERLNNIGGYFNIKSSLGNGTVASIIVPVSKEGKSEN